MKSLKTDVSEVLAFSLTYYLLMPVQNIEGYKRGFLDIQGNIIKQPKTKAEESYINPYMRMILKVKHMMRGREHELHDFLLLKTINQTQADNVINSLLRTAVNKNALNIFDTLLKNLD